MEPAIIRSAPGADWANRGARRQRPRGAREAYADTQRPSTQIPCAGAQGRQSNLEREWTAQFLTARENCVTPESFFAGRLRDLASNSPCGG